MKLKVFISSRNDDSIKIGGITGERLTDIRLWLKNELEQIKMFNKDFLDIRINETFGAATTRESYNECLEEVRKSDLIIALYNGFAGWAPTGVSLGICHSELSTALDISTRKTAIINIENYFEIIPKDKAEENRNEIFKTYVKNLNRFTNPLKVIGMKSNDNFKDSLLESVKTIIYNHLSDRIKISNSYYNLSGNNKTSLNWKKLKYSDRNKLITEKLNFLISNNPNFSKFISKAFSIPDNMSVEDAKSFTGRPFLKDQELVKGKNNLFGPIHFIGVYGNATEIQVKNLIGFPDLSAIRDDFGLYVWEQNTHIQLVFLIDCKTPEAIESNFILFNNWCDTTGEFENIKMRAEARFHILKAINEAKIIATKKKHSR
jgi:hypothetical protein